VIFQEKFSIVKDVFKKTFFSKRDFQIINRFNKYLPTGVCRHKRQSSQEKFLPERNFQIILIQILISQSPRFPERVAKKFEVPPPPPEERGGVHLHLPRPVLFCRTGCP